MTRSFAIALCLPLLGCAADDAPVLDRLCAIEEDGSVTGPEAWPCQLFVDRSAALITHPPIPGTLSIGAEQIWELTTDADHRWHFVIEEKLRWDSTTAEDARDTRAHVALHEVGHGWLAPHFDGVSHPDTIRSRYGTPAPDWLDEAWAVWFEPQVMRDRRLTRMRLDSLPSLTRLVTMRHPSMKETRAHSVVNQRTPAGVATRTVETRIANIEIMGACGPTCDWLPDSLRSKVRIDSIVRYDGGRIDTSVTWTDSLTAYGPPKPLEAEHFYPLSYSLLRYIRDTGGEAAVRELIARYRVDATPRVEALLGLPGLPTTIAAFERGWLAFLAERRPEPK
jgi:hypothetical protein